MLILTRVFCVFALRSGQTERYNIWDSPSKLELCLKIQLSIPSVIQLIGSEKPSLHWRLHGIWTIRLYFISNSEVCSSFMNYYSLSIPLHYITLCLWSVIDLFTVYFKFCQILLTIRNFELFKSDMYGFIVDLNGPK